MANERSPFGQRAQKLGLIGAPQGPAPLSDIQKLAIQNAIKGRFIDQTNYQNELPNMMGGELPPDALDYAGSQLGVPAAPLEGPSAAQMTEPYAQMALQGTGLEQVGANTVLADPNMQAAEANPVVEMVAQQEAVRQVASQKAAEVAAVQKAADDTKAAEAAAAQDLQNEEKIKKDTEESNPNLGKQIAQAVAIMVGAYSQGLTGAKENPAVVAIEKEADRQAAARKYSDEQKLKLADMMYKQAQMEIDKRKATVDSMIGLRKLEQAEQELAMKREELSVKKGQLGQLSKTRFTKEEAMSLTGEDGNRIRERLVRLPDGTFAATLGSEDAKKLRTETLPNISGSLRALSQLESLTDYFGNNPAKKVLSRAQKGVADQAVQELVGAIRLEYFGPGILTDNEQEIARSMIGNPSKVWSLDSANRAKLQNMAEKLKFSRRERLREAGVDLPLTQNETILQQAMQKYPDQTKADLINALIRQGKWNRKEE